MGRETKEEDDGGLITCHERKFPDWEFDGMPSFGGVFGANVRDEMSFGAVSLHILGGC